jgi:hypothetical protein
VCGAGACAQRPGRARDRLAAAELAAQDPKPRPVEDDPGRDACAERDLERNRAPRGTVELDRDAAATGRAQRGDRRHRPPRR